MARWCSHSKIPTEHSDTSQWMHLFLTSIPRSFSRLNDPTLLFLKYCSMKIPFLIILNCFFLFFVDKKIRTLRLNFGDTLYISVISWDGKPGIYHFCRVIRLPPDSSGNSGDAFNCFLLFPFLSSRSGARVLLFRPLFSVLARGNESDGARVTRPGSIKGEHGLAGWIYAGYPRGRTGNSVPWIVWQLCGFRAQRFSTVQRLNPVDSYYAGMKYAATI